MSTSAEDMFHSLAEERGGVAVLSLVQAAVIRALAKALVAEDIDARAIGGLAAMLPAKALGESHVDLARLSDDDLAQLEVVIEKCGVPGPAPGSDRATIDELLGMNERLQAMLNQASERARIAEEAERTYRCQHVEAVEACHDLQARLQTAEAAAWRASHPDDPAHPQAAPGQGEAIGEQPSNVIPIGNGSCAINMSLAERYPSLAHDPPVGRW